jgi:dihydroorotate dehydrogenase electron transfer subunit
MNFFMKKIHGTHTILSIKQVCAKFVQIAIESPQLAKTGRPGQFLNVRVSDGSDPLLRRPFGIYRAQDNIVEMLVEIRGRGTAILAKKKPGETLDILGPLGRPFTLPAPQVKQVILIGGGIGVAPLLALAESLKGSGKKVILLYGGRNQDYMFELSDFNDAGCQVCIATDDGSAGKKGRVSVLFDEIPDDAGAAVIYTCGPGPMMKSVQAFAKEKAIPGECSCEEVMACGTGACRGCAVNTIYGVKTACHDGPVFDLQEVIF